MSCGGMVNVHVRLNIHAWGEGQLHIYASVGRLAVLQEVAWSDGDAHNYTYRNWSRAGMF